MVTNNAINLNSQGVAYYNGTGTFSAPTITNHGPVIGDANNNIKTGSVGTNGQVFLGAAGADPAFATVTSTAGSLTYTTGANALNIDVTNFVSATSFTPGIAFGGGTTGITYTAQVGYYERHNNVVNFFINILLSNKGSSTGAATVTGFPVANGANGANVIFPVGLWSNITLTASYTAMFLQSTGNNATTYTFGQAGSGQPAAGLTNTNFANTSSIAFSGSYIIV